MVVRLFPLLFLIIVVACAPQVQVNHTASAAELAELEVQVVPGQVQVLRYDPPAPGEPGMLELQLGYQVRNPHATRVHLAELRYEIAFGEHSTYENKQPLHTVIGASESIGIKVIASFPLTAGTNDVAQSASVFSEAGLPVRMRGSFTSGTNSTSTTGPWQEYEQTTVRANLDNRTPRTTLLIDQSSVDPTPNGARFTFVLEFTNNTPFGYYVHTDAVRLELSGENVGVASLVPTLVPANSVGQAKLTFDVDSRVASERGALVITGALNGFLTGITISGPLEQDYLGVRSEPFTDPWEVHGFIRRY